MCCYFPIHAFKAKSQDKQKQRIVFKKSESWKGEKIDLPCGRCIGCRLDRAKMWAVRCVHEASLYENNCFITLTYNDENLPKDGSLCLDHFQKFMKRLRKKFGSGIRFFHAGEYGDELRRPHYHALLFNFDFADKKPFKRENGNWTYTSETLSKLWPYGFSLVAGMSYKSAGYVARYSLKKVTGEKAKEYYGNRKAEYATMSRNPGIGKKWFSIYSGDVFPNDRVVVDGCYSSVPRFYDELLLKTDPSAFALMKIRREGNRRFVDDVINGMKVKVDDNSDFRLIVREKVKQGQIALLSRNKN